MSNIVDALYKALGDLGFTGALPERVYKHLGSLGHTGGISDRLQKEGGRKAYVEGLLGEGALLRYTFDGIDDYISCDVTLGLGDTVSIDFTAPTTSYGDSRFIATARGGFAAIGVNASGGLRVNDFNSVTLDGVPISAGDAMPLDGANHVLVSTVSVTTAYIDWIGAYVGSGSPTLPTSIPLWDVKVNDGSVHNYPINDGWAANPVIANSGSGADATAMNFNEAGWNAV